MQRLCVYVCRVVVDFVYVYKGYLNATVSEILPILQIVPLIPA